MSHTRFLPGFETAPGAHRALVTSPDLGSVIRYCDAHPDPGLVSDAGEDLYRKQVVADALAPVVLGSVPAEATQEAMTWATLCDTTNSWLESHLAEVDFSGYAPEEFPTPEEAGRNVVGAARQGVATIAAFLEVIPRTLAWRMDEPLTTPDAQLAIWSARSKGFIVEWLGLSEAVDYRLADALAEEPAGDPFSVFKDLHFEWIYFIADEATGEIRLDPELVPALSSNGVRVVDADRTERPLFGCPARKMIPHLYDAMVRQATESGLLGVTYAQERAKRDAWVAYENRAS